MEVTVQVISLHLAEALPPGRYNLHCSAQTHEGGFVSSSILELNEESRVIEGNSSSKVSRRRRTNEEWMKFTYTFQHPHPVITLFMKLTDLSVADNQIELARSLLLLSFKPELGSQPQTQHRPAFLTSSLQDLPVTEHIGRLMLTATATYQTHREGRGGNRESQNLSNESTWIDLEPVHSHFPLMHVTLAESQLAFGRSEETLNPHPIVAQEGIGSVSIHANNFITFPQRNGPVLTAIFHCFATEDTSSAYQPFMKQDPADEIINSTHQHPFAVWNVEPTHDRLFQYLNILIGESQFVTQDIFSLHLLKNSKREPMFSVYENVCELLPFFYTHRCWLLAIEKPTLLTDQLMKASKHIVISLSYTPPVSTYTKYNGLELGVMRVKTNAEETREFLLTVEVMHKRSSESKEPLFLRQEKSLLTDRKLTLLKANRESQGNPVYFFFKNDSTFSESIHQNSPVLLLHVYAVDRVSRQAWWEAEPICSAEQTIDDAMHQILTEEASKEGLRWPIHWKQVGLSMEVVLRWKTISMPFLQPMTDMVLESLPLIRYDGTPELIRTDDDLLHHHTSSVIEASQYLELIDKLTDQIQQLQEENAHLKEEKGYLKGQLDQQMQQIVALASQQSIESTESMAELQAFSKSDLIHKILKLQEVLQAEIGQKEIYQQKVLAVQNELLSANNSESELLSLREAHRSQQALVKDLQRKVDKYYQCFETSVQQEKVIKQLEAIIAQQEMEKEKAIKLADLEERQAEGYRQYDEANERVPEIVERVNRLEFMTNKAQLNQASIAAILQQGTAREHHLRENLRTMHEAMTQLQAENDKLRNSQGTRPRDDGPSHMNKSRRNNQLDTF